MIERNLFFIVKKEKKLDREMTRRMHLAIWRRLQLKLAYGLADIGCIDARAETISFLEHFIEENNDDSSIILYSKDKFSRMDDWTS